MDLEIKTRHFQLFEESQEMIEGQFEKIERFSPRPVTGIKLQITHENSIFQCDGVLHLRNQEFRAESSAALPEHATQSVADHFQRQLEKFKGKISAKQRGEAGGLGVAMIPDEMPSVAMGEDFELQDLDASTAREAFAASESPFFVFRNVGNGKIAVVYRRQDGELGLMEARND